MPGTGVHGALLALLVLATTAKFAAFAHALLFGYWDRLKIGFGLEVSLVQAGLWWWMARGLGIAGVLGAWLLQSLYLAVWWSYFAYFGLPVMFATGVYYPRCLAYHGPGGSADCDVAVVEGCEPLWDAVSFNQPGYSWPNSWVRRLLEAGWSTALAHGLPAAYFNSAQVMLRLGYELRDLDRLGLVEHHGEFGARDGELVDAVLARLPSLPSPCVLHVVTMTSHAPFTQQRTWWSGPISVDRNQGRAQRVSRF